MQNGEGPQLLNGGKLPREVDCPGIGKAHTGTVDKSSGRAKGYCPACENLEPVEYVAGAWVMDYRKRSE